MSNIFLYQKGYSSKARFGFRRAKTSREQLKEAAFEPATDTAIKSNCYTHTKKYRQIYC